MGRPRRFCTEACAREWQRVDKVLAREIATQRLEVEHEEHVAALHNVPLPAHVEAWRIERAEREATTRRLRIAGLHDELDKAIQRRREHGWNGADTYTTSKLRLHSRQW